MKRLDVFRVQYQDLESYVLDVFRMREWDFLRISGCTNGMCPEYQVTGEIGSAWNAQQQADNVRRGYRTNNVKLVLNVLCQDGFIPAGKYVIDTHKRIAPDILYRRILEETRNPLDPRCVNFKEKHRGNREFVSRAKILDEACIHAMQGEEANADILP
jgi:hypothetical protein